MNIRKTMRIINVSFINLILLCQIATAQIQNSPIVLTLKDAISIALEKNYDMLLAEEEIKKSEKQINEAYSNAFPRIELSGQYTRNIKLPVLFIPPNTPFNPSPKTLTFELGSANSYNAGLSFSQVIYNQKVNTAIKIASEYADYSKYGERNTRNQVIHNVKRAFYSVLLMQELLKVSKQSYEVAKANYENVSAMFKQGVASEFDFLRAEVQLANVQPMLIQTENNLELSKNLLKNLLAMDINQPIEVKGEFVFEDVPKEVVDELSQNAVANHPMVKQLMIQSSLLDKNITIERSEYFPTLAAFGQYQYQTQDNTFNFKNYTWAKSFMLGLHLSYTIFDGFRRGARIQQAEIDKQKVEIAKLKLEDGLKIQVLQARMKMEEAKKRIYAQEKSLQQAEKALKIAQSRYKNGVGTQLEIIDTEAALTMARTNYAQAIYDFLIAKADWENAVSLE
ncbi:MAG: TolC family protein [Ignavibacteria bacterium]|nr:TolC family protein [Ignavibacteria bacterium]